MTNPRVTATADLSLLYRQRKWCVCVGEPGGPHLYPHLVHHRQWRGPDHAHEGHSRAQDIVRLARLASSRSSEDFRPTLKIQSWEKS